MPHRQRSDPLLHINEEHADQLLVVAQALGGHPDAISARAEHVDEYGLDLMVETPSGPASPRVNFVEPVGGTYPAGIRFAFVRLVRQAKQVAKARTRA